MDFAAFVELIKNRRSIRQFADRRPSREEIERLIEVACWAPSNHNRQGWKFIVFENPPAIRELAAKVRECVRETVAATGRATTAQLDEIVYYAGLFENAPVTILAMNKHSPAMGQDVLKSASSPLASGEVLSTAMAVQTLCLAAHAMGLGTCVMTSPLLAGEVWKQLPDLPAGFDPTCVVTLGYPAEQPDPPRRKDLKHVIEYR